ncbi:MAG: hypothetical protein V8S22_06265 [Lachnospiraceae bacterium]
MPGEQKNAYRVFQCAMRFAIAVGAAMSIVTFLFAGVITKYAMKAENTSYALRVLAPAIFLFAITGVFRGFFQGRNAMVPTAASQVIEQVVNAIVSLPQPFFLWGMERSSAEKKGNDSLGPAYGAAGGTLGTVVSIAVALLFLFIVYMAYRGRMNRQMRRDVTSRKEADREIYKILIWTLVPIVLSTVVYNIGTVLDQGVQCHSGRTGLHRKTVYDHLGRLLRRIPCTDECAFIHCLLPGAFCSSEPGGCYDRQ